MVSSDPFFSGLAQVTITFVSFIVAILGIIYQLEMRRVQKRTDKLRNEFLDFKEKYDDILAVLSNAFISEIGTAVDIRYLHELDGNNSGEIRSKVDSDPDINKPNATYYWACLNYIQKITLGISEDEDPYSHNLLSKNEILELDRMANLLEIAFSTEYYQQEFWGLDPNQSVISELSGTGDEGYTTEFFDDKAVRSNEHSGQNTNDLHRWLEENISEDGNISNAPGDLNGKNANSIRTLFLEMEKDLTTISHKTRGTLLTYDPKVIPILRKTFALAITGVILPILMLVTLPSSIPAPNISSTQIFLIQISLMGISILFSVSVIYDIITNISNGGQTYWPKRFDF